MVYNWLKTIQALAYPATCVLCGAPGREGRDLCRGCQDSLPHNRHACRLCALPLPATAPAGSLCGQCQQRPPRFDRCLAALRYEHPLDHLVSGLKFRDKLVYGRLLSGLLGDFLEQRGHELPQLLIPVPLHPSRQRERGFNQALELARPLARRFGIPVDIRALSRDRATAPQSGLDKKERRRNIRGAFRLREGLAARHIAIVDDVVTTGNTVDELAGVLRRGGAARVEVWAVTRRAGGRKAIAPDG